jgi:hypothetical protein
MLEVPRGVSANLPGSQPRCGAAAADDVRGGLLQNQQQSTGRDVLSARAGCERG